MIDNELKEFIKSSTWIFAKTYAQTWPHEYIVQEKVDNALFLKLADLIFIVPFFETCKFVYVLFSFS